MVVSLDDIRLYLSQGTYVKHQQASQHFKRSVRAAAANFCLREEVLYHGNRRVIWTEEEKVAVLTEAHAGHFGPRRMQAKIAPRFYWRSITQDTLDWVTTECPEVMAAPDQADSLEAFVQLRVGQDEDIFGKVINNVERAQERQKLSYRQRMKKGVKRFIIQPGMEVLKKDARKKGRPGRTMDPNWSQTIYRRSHARPQGMTVVFSCSCTPSGSVRTLLFTTVCWTCSQSGVCGVSF
ncbi:uncharacterized protein LOC133640854 isoform X1 [Entelurus aequoreus]|uniref:uncharacterized protein LOC133640854 isoform X1 n=1 Tax=Entelurus aequoreus TaxID=161455 RepID=UPI002B1E2392|nr:uncharacterized protein LOC133640854 isoform X1 [Entelurus aequoreus]